MLSELLLNRAAAQKLHGVISHQDGINEEGAFWLERFVTWEERHRSQRSLEGRRQSNFFSVISVLLQILLVNIQTKTTFQ